MMVRSKDKTSGVVGSLQSVKGPYEYSFDLRYDKRSDVVDMTVMIGHSLYNSGPVPSK